ncbi:MAG: hypothetical protein ACLP00_08790 [Terracidiphilus sp.]
MTVAAGFLFDEGLLFCVDTKVTTGIKTNESKLLYYRHDNGKCATVFAISSADLNFPRAAAESCRAAVDKINFDDASIESVRKAIQSALAKFYKEHIFPHPDRASGEVYFEMLVGIWLNNETRLFVSHETLLNPVEDCECLGSGAYLAKYLIRQYHYDRGRNTLADAGLIASLAVEAAIGYDEGCGGEPEMLILHDSGQIDAICPSVLYPGNEFAKRLQAETCYCFISWHEPKWPPKRMRFWKDTSTD